MQNVLLRLREVQPSLSSTERQIAQFILENPDETTTLTIRDLARRSFSSPSSVVRICRVIGFQGYKELRHALTLELATLGENGSHREKDITPQDSLQEIVDKVTHKNIQSLLDTQRLLLLDELEQHFDVILFDSPALESCVDAQVIAAPVHGLVLVANQHETKAKALQYALSQIRNTGAQVLGCVLNQQ